MLVNEWVVTVTNYLGWLKRSYVQLGVLKLNRTISRVCLSKLQRLHGFRCNLAGKSVQEIYIFFLSND